MPKDDELPSALSFVIRRLAENGFTDFYAGGATGFDTLAAKAVLKLRDGGAPIRLHLVLPCCQSEQTRGWSTEQKADYAEILDKADSAEYTSALYYKGCMEARNKRLIVIADCCVCCYNGGCASGTAQTVRLAKNKGIPVINVAATGSYN